jgi:hypothetical protein
MQTALVLPAQIPAPQAAAAATLQAPLPDIPTLMRQVEINQRTSEDIQKTYLYHSVVTRTEVDSHGRDTKVLTTESDHFWLNGVPVERTLRRNGKDLTPDELAKEDQRIDKEAHKAHDRREKGDANGKETDPRGNDEITVSRFLSLGAFTNPRRIQLDGRSTIVVDYAGDPHAKAQNRAEDAVRDLAGTIWVDEQDKAIVRLEGRFAQPFKLGAGLFVDVKANTSFMLQQRKVNDEVWLPARVQAQGSARIFLFASFTGRVLVVNSGYRKFRTSSRVLPAGSDLADPVQPDPAQLATPESSASKQK